MFKGILMGVSAVVLALTLALTPSLRASAITWGIGGYWDVNTTWLMCIDDSGNIATTGNPIIFVGSGNGDCGGLSAGPPQTPLDGTQFAIVDDSNGFELELKNQSNGPMCMDSRGSETNGTQFVIKPCNQGLSQSFIMCTDNTTGAPEMQLLYSDFTTQYVWLSGDNTANGTPIVVHHGFAAGRQEADFTPSPAPPEHDWYSGGCF